MKNEITGMVDLHVHTTYSDGMCAPETIVEKAIERNLRAIAITDHDCVDGIAPAIEAAKGSSLQIVSGIELSTSIDDTEIHILGYFVEWQNGIIVDKLNKLRENRITRIKEMVQLLAEQGVCVSEEKVLKSALKGTVGRLNLARVMVDEKIVRNTQEAFDKYLGAGQICCVKHEKLDYVKAIKMIKQAGGVPVLAHPGTMGNDDYIPRYIEAGIRGIEALHSKHGSVERDKYIVLAKENNLLITGGSDCHGTWKGTPQIGRVKVGYEVVEALEAEAERIRCERDNGKIN